MVWRWGWIIIIFGVSIISMDDIQRFYRDKLTSIQ